VLAARVAQLGQGGCCVVARHSLSGEGVPDADYCMRPPILTGTGMGVGTPAAVDLAVGTFDDVTLVVRAQEGDVRAFEVLVRRYQRRFYRLAVRLLGNRSDAEEAVQEAFVAAWRRLPGFRGEATFSSWMYRIVTNRCLMLLRKRRPATTLDELRDLPSPDNDSPEYAAESKDRATALQRALLNLPTDQRTCWILRELHGLGYEDIATIVAAGPDAVRGRLHRARRTLAEVMAPWR
jgi:RNA polymerase sigma-70 factor, ECF subfamily